MWAVRTPKGYVVPCKFNRCVHTAFVSRQESRAEYPPILDLKPEQKLMRQELSHHEKIRNLGTVEEKTIGINMPRLESFTWYHVFHVEAN